MEKKGFTPHHFSREKFNQTKTTKNGAGFTLIELIVVTGTIVLLTALILPNYRSGDRQLTLQRSANKVAQDLRGSQEIAISAKELEGEIPGGYGVYFDEDQPSQYVLFADLNDDRIFDSGEEIETLELEKGVKISNLSPANPLTVIFIPPDPQIFISGGSRAVITLSLETDPTNNRLVVVNKAGLISISRQLGDQCDSDTDCDDENFCTNDWCERPSDSDSTCHNDSLAGTICGDCSECHLGVCIYLCQGTESSCQCISGECRDCSIYYGENCDYGTCLSNQKPSWECSGGNCLYSCYDSPTCSVCYGVENNTQVPGCDGICRACQSGSCGVANAGTDPGDDCGTAGCYTGSCNDSGGCAIYSSGEKGSCSTCYYCNDADSACDSVTAGQDPTNDCAIGECNASATCTGKAGAATTYFEYDTSYNSNPAQWGGCVDYAIGAIDYEGEMSFNLSSISGASISSAQICAYAFLNSGTPTNYIEKLTGSTASTAPSVSAAPANIGSAVISVGAWRCIGITAGQVSAGSTNYFRWWGQDLNGGTTPWVCFRGPAETDLGNCGGSNPSGGSNCRPYLDITYTP